MSATIPESMRLDDLLKATGYDCPVDLQGKTFDQATEGGDVPTDWYLWQDNSGNYRYLPFETAPDTLDSMQYIMIGDSLTSDTSLSTMEVANYIKISDSSFGIGKASYNRITEDVPLGGSSFFDTITLNIDNPTYSKTLTKGATVYMNNKYVNMLVGKGNVTDTVESIGVNFATITYVDSTQVLTVTLNTSHPEASEGAPFKTWGE